MILTEWLMLAKKVFQYRPYQSIQYCLSMKLSNRVKFALFEIKHYLTMHCHGIRFTNILEYDTCDRDIIQSQPLSTTGHYDTSDRDIIKSQPLSTTGHYAYYSFQDKSKYAHYKAYLRQSSDLNNAPNQSYV